MSISAADVRHRFGYHSPSPESAKKHELIREAFIAFGDFLREQLPDGRAKSTAFTKLQEASMWANFGIAELSPVSYPAPPEEFDIAHTIATSSPK